MTLILNINVSIHRKRRIKSGIQFEKQSHLIRFIRKMNCFSIYLIQYDSKKNRNSFVSSEKWITIQFIWVGNMSPVPIWLNLEKWIAVKSFWSEKWIAMKFGSIWKISNNLFDLLQRNKSWLVNKNWQRLRHFSFLWIKPRHRDWTLRFIKSRLVFSRWKSWIVVQVIWLEKKSLVNFLT